MTLLWVQMKKEIDNKMVVVVLPDSQSLLLVVSVIAIATSNREYAEEADAN